MNHLETFEIVPLADRLRWMLIVRLGLLGATVLAWAAEPGFADRPLSWLLLPGLLNVGLSLAMHPLALKHRTYAQWSFTGPALLDGAFLGWALYLLGATSGPVVHLIVLHVLAVTLLASFRMGMKLAFWHSLVALTLLQAVSTGAIEPMGASTAFDPGRYVLFLGAVWLTALTTASLAAVNERELRRRRYDEEALRRFGLGLHETASCNDVAAALLDFALDAGDARRASVQCTLNGQQSRAHVELAVRLVAGQEIETLRHVEAPTAGSLLATAGAARRTVLAAMKGADPWVDAVLPGAERVIVVPFHLDGQVRGTLAFEHDARAGSRVERRRLALAEQAVSHAATAFARAALVEHLQASALTDGLTGIANRRAFDDALGRMIAGALRAQATLSVVLVDLDHFKSLNDRHGHLAGDDVLRGVGAALRSCVRQGDVVARYGGEEFALILPRTTTQEAVATAERVRDALRSVSAPVPVTASLGIAEVPVHAVTAAELLAAADKALYAAKAGGRDQARIAPAPEPGETPPALPAPRAASEDRQRTG